jgi:hypothetical protein
MFGITFGSSILDFLLSIWVAPLSPSFFGVGMGPNQEQKKEQGVLSGIGDFGVKSGENAINQSQGFWSSILSGDMDKIMKVLGPQISAIKGQGQQMKQTAAQFGNRSGGMNASAQMADDRTRSEVNNLISSLTGAAASNLGSMGISELGIGEGASKDSFSAASVIQELNAKKWGDIFNSIAAVAGGVAGMPGLAGTQTGKILTGAAGMLG